METQKDLQMQNEMNTSTPAEMSMQTDYRLWLQSEFVRRCRKNPSYSVRAFAHLLNLDSSTVSQIMSGKRKISAKIVARLCDRLGVSTEERTELLKSCVKKSRAERFSQPSMEPTQENFRAIARDAFAVISEWYHFAMLDLTYVKGFKKTAAGFARALNITADEARIAIERLLRLGLIEGQEGDYRKTQKNMTNFGADVTNPAMRSLQFQVMKMGIEALENVPMEQRDMSSMTMAIDPAKLPEAKRRIREMRRDLCTFLEDGEATQVYQLGIQLYPLSKNSMELVAAGEE